jgi:hypothetical protein
MLWVARVSTLAISASILTSSLLFAETDEARMKRSYRVTPDGTFIIEPGVSAKAAFDEHGGACTFTLFGEMSEDKVLETFDVLVPTNERGSKKPQDMLECIGSCLRSFFYNHVTLSTGSVGKVTSDPAAIISFKRSDCKAAVAEANKQVWHLNQDLQAVKTERNRAIPK